MNFSLARWICQRCVKERCQYKTWCQVDDRVWSKHGVIDCRTSGLRFAKQDLSFGKNLLALIDNHPPNWCPYAVEHVVEWAASEANQ